jgi:putative transposase
MLTRCEGIMREVCEGVGAELREFNIETDHVHLLAHYPQNVALSRLVTPPSRSVWPALLVPSYFAGSCGGAPISIIND